MEIKLDLIPPPLTTYRRSFVEKIKLVKVLTVDPQYLWILHLKIYLLVKIYDSKINIHSSILQKAHVCGGQEMSELPASGCSQLRGHCPLKKCAFHITLPSLEILVFSLSLLMSFQIFSDAERLRNVFWENGHWRNFLQHELESCGQESSVDESTVCIRKGVFKQNHTQTSYVLTAAHRSTAAMAHPYVPMSLCVLPLQNVSTLNNENQLSFQSQKWPTLVTDSTGPSFQKGKVKTFMCVDVQLLS